MMMRLAAFWLIGFWPALTYAQAEPQNPLRIVQVVDDPAPTVTRVPLGRMLILRAEGPTVTHASWLVFPFNGDFQTDLNEGGLKFTMAAKAGTYNVACTSFVEDKYIVRRWIVIFGDGPAPPPDQPPPDNPPPDQPPPLDLDLSDDARIWYQSVPNDARVRTKNVRETLTEIGTRAKEVGSIEACDVLLALGLTASFETDAAKWQAFADQADRALAALKTKGVTVAQYGQALASIARGLE